MSRAVAISTTGEDHRLGFLETAVMMWDSVLSPGDSLFVTVDGSLAVCERVLHRLSGYTGSVFRVGRPYTAGHMDNEHRMGVAVNKNTGLELMMDNTSADHLFLCDDDTYPLSRLALDKHTELSVQHTIGHSMVCWGAHRLQHQRDDGYATWLWPRGVLLYTHRTVVDEVGGMLEAFGPGGHEHAEYSRRIHQHGFTPAPYVTPLVYALTGVNGSSAYRADKFWHCEDMRRPGERSVELGHRRRALTTLPRHRDWEHIEKIMSHMDGKTSYVPFRSHQNRRASATLIPTSTSRGAGGDL